MQVSIYIPTPYRRLTDGVAHIPCELATGSTLAGLVDAVESHYPGLRAEIWEGEDFKSYVNVYVNGEEVRALNGCATVLNDGDHVAFVPMLAGGTAALVLRADQVDEIVAHAREEFPNECCGLLSGHGAIVRQVHRMTNAAASPTYYEMDPREQIRTFDAIDRAGEDLIAIYHSHTRTRAYPSETDIRMAYYPETIYVIVSLEDFEAPTVGAFTIADGLVSTVEVQVVRRDSALSSIVEGDQPN